MYYQYICDIGEEKLISLRWVQFDLLAISGEASPTFGHANANFSVFIYRITKCCMTKCRAGWLRYCSRSVALVWRLQWNEYNWNATSIVIDGKIMKPNFAWYFTQTRVSGWSITRVSFATIPRTNYEERANDERTMWRQTWVPRESKFGVCLKHTYRCSYSHEK